MANETTTTTMTGGINTSLISRVWLNYAIDPVTFLPHSRAEFCPAGTKTIAFNLPTKGSAAATSEADMSNTALTLANTTVAVAEYGVLRAVTKLAARTNVLGEAELNSWLIQDGYRLCLDKCETDLWDQASNASTSIGTSGATLSLAHFAQGISQLAIAMAQGNPVALLSTYAMRDIRSALVGSTASVWVNNNNRLLHNRDRDGYAGNLMGAEVYTSNKAETSGSDKLSIMMIDGAEFPENAATGVALGWLPEAQIGHSLPLSGNYVSVTMAYGAAEIADFNYLKFTSIGS